MIAKEKAMELVEKYGNLIDTNDEYYSQEEMIKKHNQDSKQCALIAVDEILDLNLGLSNCDENNWDIDKFYNEVKQEINNL